MYVVLSHRDLEEGVLAWDIHLLLLDQTADIE